MPAIPLALTCASKRASSRPVVGASRANTPPAEVDVPEGVVDVAGAAVVALAAGGVGDEHAASRPPPTTKAPVRRTSRRVTAHGWADGPLDSPGLVMARR